MLFKYFVFIFDSESKWQMSSMYASTNESLERKSHLSDDLQSINHTELHLLFFTR